MNSPGEAPQVPPQYGFTMDFDPVHRVLRLSEFAVVTDETMILGDRRVRQFLADEGADFGIFDYSTATEFLVTAHYVRAIAENAPPPRPMKLRVAIAPQTVAYGLNRMYSLLIEQKRSDFQTVRTMKEAEDLIGLGKLDFSRTL